MPQPVAITCSKFEDFLEGLAKEHQREVSELRSEVAGLKRVIQEPKALAKETSDLAITWLNDEPDQVPSEREAMDSPKFASEGQPNSERIRTISGSSIEEYKDSCIVSSVQAPQFKKKGPQFKPRATIQEDDDEDGSFSQRAGSTMFNGLSRLQRFSHVPEDVLRLGTDDDLLDEMPSDWLERARELKRWFNRLDFAQKGHLTADDIYALVEKADGVCKRPVQKIEVVIGIFNDAVESIPRENAHLLLGRTTSSIRSSSKSYYEISRGFLKFVAFAELVLWDQVVDFLESNDAFFMLELRDALVRNSIDELIVQHSHLDMPKYFPSTPKSIHVLESLVAALIMINSVIIGVSTDVEWKGFDILEIAFTICFFVEIVLKIYIYQGIKHFYSGGDAPWNVFDALLVALAIFDLILGALVGGENDVRNVTIVRLARLARLTRLMRLLRLLRLRCFKELMLMVKGVFAGLRTLFWSIVLLLFVVYLIAILLRQTIGDASIEHPNGSQKVFDSIPWSMFTVFRCISSDCNLTDGSPLAAHLYDKYGLGFGIPYVLTVLFITFGICNLIMAIFVENVQEAATQKRQLKHEDECARVCRCLRELVMSFGRSETEIVPEPDVVQRIRQTVALVASAAYESNPSMKSAASDPWGRRALVAAKKTLTGEMPAVSLYFQFGGQITRKMFNVVIDETRVNNLLDDLDIHVSDRSEIFDVLDADGSGVVDLSELISGLLKLRTGGADKSDTVATILGIRALRKQLDGLISMLHSQSMVFEHIQATHNQLLQITKKGDRLSGVKQSSAS